MSSPIDELSEIDKQVGHLFALVVEALAGATYTLLNGGVVEARSIVEADAAIDDLATEVEALIWSEIESSRTRHVEMRRLVNLLIIVPELERSADLAEHIASRAVANLGAEMSPVSRGYVQRMSEVAIDMWRTTALAYQQRLAEGVALDEADEEIDILHERLTLEIATGSMPTAVASQVTLIARFYERLGDHAVNVAHRIGTTTKSR